MDIKSRETRDLTENWDYWLRTDSTGKDGASIWFTGYYQVFLPYSPLM